jgi:glycosyltransferase involved in cell wall biosynthesis
MPSKTALPDARRPTVSVIMANYNGAAYLADAIESARRQTLSDLEIIVSDDGSTDASLDIVRCLMTDDGRIRLIESERNGGPGAARNRAISLATGEWIAVMDSDDLMHTARLATLVEAARRDGADMVADDLVAFESDISHPLSTLLTGPWAQNPQWVQILDYVRLNDFYTPGPALGCLKPIFRASILRDPKSQYDESLTIAEDFDLVLRLLHAGKTFRVYPDQLYLYRQHSASITRDLSEGSLKAILAANLRFHDQVSRDDTHLAAAIITRGRSIETAIAYGRLMRALKVGDFRSSLAIAVARPQAALLLRLPLRVRLHRLAASLQRRRGASPLRVNSHADHKPPPQSAAKTFGDKIQ